MSQENQHHQAPGVDPPPPSPPTSDPPPPAGAYPPPGQVCPPPQVQGHNQGPYVVPPQVAFPMKNNEPEGDPQGRRQSAPFLHRRSEDGFWTECGSAMFWCLLRDLSLFGNCVTNSILNPSLPDQKRRAPFLIMCTRPKGMTIVGCQYIAIATFRIYNIVK